MERVSYISVEGEISVASIRMETDMSSTTPNPPTPIIIQQPCVTNTVIRPNVVISLPGLGFGRRHSYPFRQGVSHVPLAPPLPTVLYPAHSYNHAHPHVHPSKI